MRCLWLRGDTVLFHKAIIGRKFMSIILSFRVLFPIVAELVKHAVEGQVLRVQFYMKFSTYL